MTKTRRPIAIEHGQSEKGKVIFISSAYLKTSDLYKRFKYHYTKMVEGSKDYYVCTLPYQVGVASHIFDEDDILKELEKPTMTKEKFDYEYGAIFVGSSGDSYYPYDLTESCRVLEKCELEQSKKSTVEYIICHDVAISDATTADNACTTVIKLKPKPNGTFIKELVYIKTHKGMPLPAQRDFLRELIHIKFPNTTKLVIDMRGNGESLPSLFYESWEYLDEKTKQTTEYPPLVLDDDENARKNIKGAMPMIRGVTATNIFNNTMYSYMKSCFEDMSIRLLVNSAEVDDLCKSGEMTPDEFALYMDTDLLIQELSNIKQEMSDSNNIIYDRIVKTMKRDRATSLGYNLAYIYELEMSNRRNMNRNNNYLEYLMYN